MTRAASIILTLLSFLCELLNAMDIEIYITGIDQRKLTQENLNRIPTIMPPSSLQDEFAQRVQEGREIQSRQAQSAERIEALYQSMLSRAFAGEL